MSKNEFICDCNIIHEDSVKFAKSKMPNDEIFYKLADFYKLIGDTTRCKILFVLILMKCVYVILLMLYQ